MSERDQNTASGQARTISLATTNEQYWPGSYGARRTITGISSKFVKNSRRVRGENKLFEVMFPRELLNLNYVSSSIDPEVAEVDLLDTLVTQTGVELGIVVNIIEKDKARYFWVLVP